MQISRLRRGGFGFLGIVVSVFSGLQLVREQIWSSGRAGELGPGFWPALWVLALGFCCAKDLAEQNWGGSGESKVRGTGTEEGSGALRLWGATVVTVAYALAMPWVGFFWGSCLFLSLFAAVSEGWVSWRRTAALIVVAVIGTAALSVIFVGLFGLTLPVGVGALGDGTATLYRLMGIWRF